MLSNLVWGFVLSVLAVSVRASNYSCPTWFYYSNTTQRCECGFETDWLICDKQTMTVHVIIDFCVTYSGQEGLFYIGRSPRNNKFNNTNRMFSEHPTDPDQLEDKMCGPYNRKGLLCGECIDGYGPGVYTLDSKCADCSKFSTFSAIFLYLLVDLVPITLFFICVVMFHLNITAGPLLGYVLFCQEYSTFLGYYPMTYEYVLSHLSPGLAFLVQIWIVTIKFWNINYLKPVIPPFCISEKLKGIHVLVLNSLSTLYPVILVIASLVVIELHARKNSIIHVLLKPFSCILNTANIRAVTGSSVLSAYATFMFLSSTGNLFAFYALTRNIYVHRSIDGSVYKRVLFADPTIEFLSPTHVMFLVIPLVQCVFLVFIPSLLLIIYPTRVYRRMSEYLSARKRLAITAFVESLNSCFKDGLNGTRDYRVLAGVLFFAFPVCNNFVLIMEEILHGDYNINIFFFYFTSLLSLLVCYIRPFKSTVANMSVSFCFIMYGFLLICSYLWSNQLSVSTLALEVTFAVIVISVQIPVVVWALYKVCYALRRFFTTHFPAF